MKKFKHKITSDVTNQKVIYPPVRFDFGFYH